MLGHAEFTHREDLNQENTGDSSIVLQAITDRKSRAEVEVDEMGSLSVVEGAQRLKQTNLIVPRHGHSSSGGCNYCTVPMNEAYQVIISQIRS